MKKAKYFPVLLTLLSSFSCITNANQNDAKWILSPEGEKCFEEQFRPVAEAKEKNKNKNNESKPSNPMAGKYTSKNDAKWILSQEGQKFFEKRFRSVAEAKEKNKNKNNGPSNSMAGKYTSLTDFQKMGLVAVPLSTICGYYLHNSISSTSEKESAPDCPSDYKKAGSSYSIPVTLDSFKSLVCICENLKVGQFRSQLDEAFVPKEGSNPLMGRSYEKVKWGKYASGYRPYDSEQFLCAVQRVAIHKDKNIPLSEAKLKNWMKTHKINEITDDELKKKWNNINPDYRETIKSIFVDSSVKTSKQKLYDYVNELTSGDFSDDVQGSRIITDTGIRKYVSNDAQGELVSELAPVD